MNRFILLAIVLFITSCTGSDQSEVVNIDPPENSTGQTLFKANCASCHKADKDFVGPALKGTLERWGGDKKAMYAFIKNPSEQESEYINALEKKWAPAIMTAFPMLSDAEIDSIMNYVEWPMSKNQY